MRASTGTSLFWKRAQRRGGRGRRAADE